MWPIKSINYRIRGESRNLQKGVGQSLSSPSSPLFSLFPSSSLSSHLEVGLLKPARGSGEHCKLPQLGSGRARSKTNSVHSEAVRKPLVAIIFNILGTMFYSRTIKI